MQAFCQIVPNTSKIMYNRQKFIASKNLEILLLFLEKIIIFTGVSCTKFDFFIFCFFDKVTLPMFVPNISVFS